MCDIDHIAPNDRSLLLLSAVAAKLLVLQALVEGLLVPALPQYRLAAAACYSVNQEAMCYVSQRSHSSSQELHMLMHQE